MTTKTSRRGGLGPPVRRRSRAALFLVALAAALGGCGGDGGGGGGTAAGETAGDTGQAPPGGAPVEIVIRDFAYSPIPARVTLGQSVTVTNEDTAAHTLTVPGGIDSGNLAQGKSFTFTPGNTGTLDYLCDIHQYMKGQIEVR